MAREAAIWDFMLTNVEKAGKNQAREFVNNEVSPELIKKRDRDEIKHPREYIGELGSSVAGGTPTQRTARRNL